MQEIRQVTQVERNGIDEDGEIVRERTSSVSTQTGARTTAANIVWYIFGIFAMLLLARFILKIAGANPDNGFVDFIYSASGALSAPFDSAFGVNDVVVGEVRSVFEPSILVAIVVYLLIAWGITRLLMINQRSI